MQFEFKGMQERLQKLERARVQMQGPEMKKALRAGGKVAERAMKEHAPVLDKKTTGSNALSPGALGFEVPLPAVFEGGNLGGGAAAVFFGEEDVVVLAGVEGWVEVDEVDGLVRDVVAEDFEVVAVVELVFGFGHVLG